MQSVTVLTPHGRRQVVKIEPNKTVLSILEIVCQKFDFDPENYGLKHHNKFLDLSQMFRFAGIPNNATVEIVLIDKKRVEQSCVICLQLEDSRRLNGEFTPSTTLREIINSLCPEKSSADQNPVVVYMRNEVYGEALDSTTLKTLGLLSGGRALLRLINTDPESLKVQANVSAPLPQRPREESPERPRQKSNVEGSSTAGMIKVEEIKRLKQEVAGKDEKKVEPMDFEEEKPVEVEKEVKTATSEVEVAEVEAAEEEPPVINILDNRGTIIFSLDTMKTSTIDVPDSFFELTESEVRKLYRELKTQVDEIENKPLMTSELRKLEENKKILNQLSIYKSCAIRIQMPNRLVIQSKFSTVEKVGDVMDFVKQFLVNPEQDFHLFVTPPKTILDKNETLIESNCVPSALLHFGTDGVQSGEFLKPEVFEKLSSGSGASRVLITSDHPEDNQAGVSEVEAKKPAIPKNFMTSKASSTTGTVPKWFKPGK